jgi:hypothetical protein
MGAYNYHAAVRRQHLERRAGRGSEGGGSSDGQYESIMTAGKKLMGMGRRGLYLQRKAVLGAQRRVGFTERCSGDGQQRRAAATARCSAIATAAMRKEDSSSQAWQARTSNEKKDLSRRLKTV